MRRIPKRTGVCAILASVLLLSTWSLLGVGAQLLPTFSVDINPTVLNIPQGASDHYVLVITSINNFNNAVLLSITGVPAGVVALWGPNPVTPPHNGQAGTTLYLTVAPNAPMGSYGMTVIATSGSQTKYYPLALQITGPDFTLSVQPATRTVQQGGSSTATVVVSSVGTFSSPVFPSLSSGPAGVSVSFSPYPLTPSPGVLAYSTATVTVASYTAAGTYSISIIGTSDGLSHTATLTLTIVPRPDFSMSANPSWLTLDRGATGTSTITIQSKNGFKSAVSLSAYWIGSGPSGVTVSLTSPVTPPPNQATTSPLIINAVDSTSTGTYTLRVHGASGTLAHDIDVSVELTGKCLIATATYGSELSPEVQYLRNLRDNMVLKTRAGSAFMTAFNAWYYSFSPDVAQQIGQNSALRGAMVVALYPAIALLRVGSVPFTLAPANGELAAVISGLVVSFSLGATYLGLPTALLLKFNSALRRRTRTLERTTALILLAGLIALGIGEVTSLAALMIVGSSVLVLSAVVLSALLSSRLVIRLTKIVN